MRTFALLLLTGVVATAADWSRFRGPNGSGISDDRTILTKWTDKDFAWRVPVPGVGHASPVIWGNRVFVTSAEKNTGKRLVLAYDLATGKPLWSRELAGGKYKTHRANSFATSTPAVDAERLYTLWATPDECVALAFDHDGKDVWKTSLGAYKSQHGFGMSPVLHQGLLIAHVQPDGAGRVVALDAKTGKQRWSLQRSGKNATYSTPCVRDNELILTNWQHGISAVDAIGGQLRWEKSVFDTTTQQRSIASPVVAGDLVLGIAGFAGGAKRLVAVRPAERGAEVWRYEAAVPQMSTPLVVGDRVFLATEMGFAVWLDAKTGKEIWKKRLDGQFHASPLLIGGRLYCASTQGKMIVLEAKDDYAVIAQNPIGEGTQATPAVADGRLVIRTDGHLVCINGK